MTSIIQLPYELLALVSGYAQPADVVNFALTCKRLHAAAEAALITHRSLMQQYGSVSSHNATPRMFYLADLLNTVIRDPRISFYIRHISLSLLTCRWDAERAGLPSNPIFHCPPADLEPVRELAREVNYPFARDQEHFVHSGGEDVFAGLLILRLPHLSSLTWQADSRSYANSLFFKSVARMVQRLDLNPLTRLKKVTLRREGGSWGMTEMSFRNLAFFMALPSVHTMDIGPINGLSEIPEKASGVRESKVSDLSLYCGDLYSNSIERILALPRAMRKFTYRCPDICPINVRAIMNSLVAHTCDSLESLTLRSDWPSSSADRLDQLWRLPNLRFLSTDLSLLLSDDDCWTPRSTFPKPVASLEHIQLYEDFLLRPADALRSLRILIEAKQDIFPKLSGLDVYFPNYHPEKEKDYMQSLGPALSDLCEENMVAYQIILYKPPNSND